jgi:hypothetical protein
MCLADVNYKQKYHLCRLIQSLSNWNCFSHYFYWVWIPSTETHYEYAYISGLQLENIDLSCFWKGEFGPIGLVGLLGGLGVIVENR